MFQLLMTFMFVPAPSVADVQAAIEYIFPLVYEFRKERTKEELEQLALKKHKQACAAGVFDHTEDEEPEKVKDNSKTVVKESVSEIYYKDQIMESDSWD